MACQKGRRQRKRPSLRALFAAPQKNISPNQSTESTHYWILALTVIGRWLTEKLPAADCMEYHRYYHDHDDGYKRFQKARYLKMPINGGAVPNAHTALFTIAVNSNRNHGGM